MSGGRRKIRMLDAKLLKIFFFLFFFARQKLREIIPVLVSLFEKAKIWWVLRLTIIFIKEHIEFFFKKPFTNCRTFKQKLMFKFRLNILMTVLILRSSLERGKSLLKEVCVYVCVHTTKTIITAKWI